MASKNDNDYDDDDDDDEEEEDEGDFVPGADDDDELDDDFVDEDDDEEEDDGDSPILQGHLYLDEGNAIVYEDVKDDSKLFCLTSSSPVPDSSWSPAAPTLKPTELKGFIKDRNHTLTMEISISKLDPSAAIDPLEQRFLDSQAEGQAQILADGDNGKQRARAKAGDEDDEEEDAKSPAASSDGKKKAAGGDIFVLTGKQQVSADNKSGVTHTLRGLFRAPKEGNVSRLFIIAAIQTTQAVAAAASSPAKPHPPAAAAARKRGRGDDDEDDGDDGVGYQELIDLHDDAGLSTEELRRRYYGGGAAAAGASESNGNNNNTKKPKPSSPADDDDDDDAYGF